MSNRKKILTPFAASLAMLKVLGIRSRTQKNGLRTVGKREWDGGEEETVTLEKASFRHPTTGRRMFIEEYVSFWNPDLEPDHVAIGIAIYEEGKRPDLESWEDDYGVETLDDPADRDDYYEE